VKDASALAAELVRGYRRPVQEIAATEQAAPLVGIAIADGELAPCAIEREVNVVGDRGG